MQRFNSPPRRWKLNVYKCTAWRGMRGERQLLHRAKGGGGIIMAILKLKSRDIIQDNSIYYDPSTNVQPRSLSGRRLLFCCCR